MRRFSIIALAILLLTPSIAFAHAHLTSATPPVDGAVKTAPTQVILTFTESVEPAFSTIEVLDSTGARVDAQEKPTTNGDAKRLITGLKPLAAGVYKVIWHITSTDTHKTEGSFTFTVAP